VLIVTVFDHLQESSVESEVLAGVADVHILGQDWSRADALRSSDGILMWHIDRLPADEIGALGATRIIQRVGVGFDNVDLVAARERNIAVCNVPDYGTEDVADHAMALMLALSRSIWAYGLAVREDADGWSWFKAGRANARLRGLHLGLVGAGRIGTAVALRAKAFGLRVSFYDPYKADGHEKAIGVERVRSLQELAGCDIVSLHTPLTQETRGMIDEAFLRASDRPMTLINTARGPIVDEEALCEAYRRGRVNGLGTDVLEREPLGAETPIGRLLKETPGAARDILITPHAAFFCPQAYRELRQKAAENVRRCLVDGSHRNIVNAL
jgi:lactate dehydrogenase-like 2-hydroxyacid dehydrogenase